MKAQQAVQRLNKILPIKNRLDKLDQASAQIYLAVVNGFYQQGKAPSLHQLTQLDDNAGSIVAQLGEQDMLTLEESGEVKGCYPFTMESRVHRIQLNGFEVHAMCALDALAPSAMFECSSVINSECAVSGEPVHVELENQRLVNAEEVADLHFGINWQAASSCCSCSDSLCTEMLFLKNTEIAQDWLAKDTENREIFNMDDAIAFSAGFFKPMMQQSSG